MPTQVENFLDKAHAEVGAPAAPSPDEPKVPFQSNLKLNALQEKRMIEHAFSRLRTLQNEMGRDQTLSPTWWQNQAVGANNLFASQGFQACETFLGKRARYDATFMNDVSWRPYVFGPENIFQSSNLATPVVRRVCRQMIARAKNSFFGTPDWFNIDPSPVPEFDPVNDAERADRIEKFCRFKLRESNTTESMERAISRALVLGECAVKTSYVVRDQVFNTEARVLVDTDNQPVMATDGNMITEGEEFVDAVDPLGEPKRVLKRDGVTEEPIAPLWRNQPIDRRQVLFEGAKSEVIYYKDWLMPLTAEDVQTADCCVHLYDKPVMAFVDLVVKRGMVGADTPDRIAAAQKIVTLVQTLSANSASPKAAVKQDNRPNDHFTNTPSVETGGPVAEFCEFYLWFDANGDGVAENIMLICDRKSQAPIFYDHVANVTTDGLRPVEIVRINPVEGRWYGQGIMELFDSFQVQIDLMVNRWNLSQSRAGRVDFWRPTDTLEGDRDPNLKLNWGGTYTAKMGAKVDEILHSVYLNDIKFTDIQTMIQFFLQLLLNESGVANANDDQAAGMQSSKLATGILETTKSGDELFRPIIADLKGPLERILTREIAVVLANLNPVEIFTYLEGDTQGIERLTADDVRGLRFKTEITLTSQRTQEKIQISAQVIAIIKDFYSLDPMVQQYVAAEYRKQLRSLDPTVDANITIVPLPIMPMGAEGGGTESGGANTPFSAQLGQKSTQMPGVSAPGGTPRAA